MAVITEQFLNDVIASGRLAEAAARVRNGTASPRSGGNWDSFGSWELVCEEVLDTDHDAEMYDTIIATLLSRGLSFDDINDLRRFAWRTAGWLNYDKMLWEWCHLGESDIRLALDWQLRDRIITAEQHVQGLQYLARYAKGGEPQS